MRKPIIPKLIFLKKARRLKKFKLLKHYHYGFLEEYQFSASTLHILLYALESGYKDFSQPLCSHSSKKTTLFSPVLHNINRGGERKRMTKPPLFKTTRLFFTPAPFLKDLQDARLYAEASVVEVDQDGELLVLGGRLVECREVERSRDGGVAWCTCQPCPVSLLEPKNESSVVLV
jgi:hypothetical protein